MDRDSLAFDNEYFEAVERRCVRAVAYLKGEESEHGDRAAWTLITGAIPNLVAEIRNLGTDLEAAERDRDLAIAHDRQPYPTAWAYERVCEVLSETKAERDRLAAQVARLEADLAKVQWAPRDMDGEP